MSNLLIEIGNTALKAAWSDRMTLGKTFRYQGEKAMEFILSLTKKDVPVLLVKDKLQQLFDEKWIAGVWDNFTECLKENLGYGLFKV